MSRELRVVRRDSGEIVHRVAVGDDETLIMRIMMGMLRNMDTARFRVEDSADDWRRGQHGRTTKAR